MEPKVWVCEKGEYGKRSADEGVGLPLHLWTVETLRRIGDSCGGFVDVDQDTTLRTKTM